MGFKAPRALNARLSSLYQACVRVRFTIWTGTHYQTIEVSFPQTLKFKIDQILYQKD
jgi:hypothetical protein